MSKHLTLLFVLALLVGGCTPASSTPSPTVTVTSTIVPSPTPLATPTPVPQTQEHLLITRDREHWASLRADGSLQKYIQATDISTPSEVSPDGHWLIYESGAFEEEPYDFSLRLLNLEDGTFQFVAKLISPNFPENIEPIVKSTFQYDPALYGKDCADIACRRSLVKEEVAISAGISQWSPDGQWLAFAAQIDGPSTDIYLYSMQEQTLRRLTDELQNIERLIWSPDGRRLLYTNMIPGTDFEGMTFHVIDLEGKSLQISQKILTEHSRWYMHDWLANNLYLLQADHWRDPPQFRQLVVLNTENGEVTEIWPYPTDKVVIDPDTQAIVLSFSQPSITDPIPNAPEPGTYIISTNGERKKISDLVFYSMVASSQIIATTEERLAYHISGNGSIEQIGPTDSGWSNSVSPDKKWFFIYAEEHDEHYRFSLYNDTYQPIKSWTLEEDVLETTWRPDSLGMFLITEGNIYYLEIPDGEPRRLDVEIPSAADCNGAIHCIWPWFAWRP